MFLCSTCAGGAAAFWVPQSFGRCEDCGQRTACYDVPGSQPVNQPRKQEITYLYMAAASSPRPFVHRSVEEYERVAELMQKLAFEGIGATTHFDAYGRSLPEREREVLCWNREHGQCGFCRAGNDGREKAQCPTCGAHIFWPLGHPDGQEACQELSRAWLQAHEAEHPACRVEAQTKEV